MRFPYLRVRMWPVRLLPKWLRREIEEARDSRREAEELREKVNGQWDEVHDMTQRLNRYERRNMFAEALRKVLRT